MSPRCDDLDPFFDGELADDASAAFRDHLAGCEHCQRALRGRMLEAAVVSGSRRVRSPMAEVIALRPRRGAGARRGWVPVAAAAVAAAAIALWWLRPSGAPSPTAAQEPGVAKIALQLAPRRGVDVRFSAPSLDLHRPRNIVRGTSFTPEKLTLKELAALEQDRHAVLGGLALVGNLASAREQASQLPRDAASLADRAALALLEISDDNKASARASAERALSFASEARRLDPGFAPAMWNEAVALERLQLGLAAAVAFEAIAKRGEPGWSAEAKERAAELRRRLEAERAAHKQLVTEARGMSAGGAAMAAARAKLVPSVAKSALYVAIAAAPDAARLAELAPLADAVGLVPELERARRDVARRAPIARDLAAAVEKRDPATLRAIRARARAAGLEDVVRATALLIRDRDVTRDDLPTLEALSGAGPWWRLVSVARRVFYLTYRTQHYAEADLAASSVMRSCRADAPERDELWCPQILRALASSNAEIGRVDRAYGLAAEAQRIAHEAGDREEEGSAFNVTGQIAAARVVEWLEPSAVSDAYMRESAYRLDSCSARLYQLDFGARAALDHHRFEDAARLLAEADRLDQTEPGCQKEGVRYNAEEVRLRLIVHRPTSQRVDELARRVQRIEERWGNDLYPENRLYNEYLLARARLALADHAPSLAALRDVIARAQTFSGQRYPQTIRTMGHAALAEHAARNGAAEEALGSLAARVGVQLEPGCVVGVSHDDRVTVIVRGANGRTSAEIREVPEGQRVLASPELLSRALREPLVGCPSIEVIATGPYLGVAGLLGSDLRWTYRSSPRRATGPLRFDRQVVVTDVEPPAELGLPPLRRMQLGPAARVLAGRMATPSGVLDAIGDAELVVINAHGITDANEPSAASLVLSPDATGSYWLTADRVKQARLAGAPVVILAACHAGRVQVSTEPWSLASSFLAAGARAVIAPTTEIPDDTANSIFEAIVKRMQSGRSPEQAVAEEREASGDRAPWLANVVVFQ